MSLAGQWIARYDGTNRGVVVIDIDDVGDHFEGAACAWDDSHGLPSSLVQFGTSSKADSQRLTRIPIQAMDKNGAFIDRSNLPSRIIFPENADIDLELAHDELRIVWQTSVGTGCACTAIASKTRAGTPSELAPLEVNTWESFKNYVSRLPKKKFIFRGQENSEWRLRSSFHRTGRANLDAYFRNDINDLRKIFSSVVDHQFNLQDSIEYAAFINLAQHHGYPTPFLDWTWSPFVAAFFAFRRLNPRNIKTSQHIRIYQFDAKEWNKIPQVLYRNFPVMPHVSILDAIATNNPRAVPQQSISTISNIDDIESYLSVMEKTRDRKYLDVIDLPASDRDRIMHELALMGITAGSMLPGLDGACEALRERNFEFLTS